MKTRIGLTLALLTALGSGTATAAPVIGLGDSWAFDGSGALQTSLQGAGFPTFTVDNRGVPGLTAQTMATQTASIAQAVAANPDARWVWLSIGGNDLVNRALLETPAQIAAANDQNMRSVITSILAANPNLRIVMYGYDYLNYLQSPQCMMDLATQFGPTATQLDVANLFVTTIGAVMQGIADDFPNVNYVPLYGTMQLAAGLTGAPDPSQPTPASHMRDCIHPNAVGFAALHNTLVASYWAQPMPTATAMASQTTICSGDIVTFTSMSTANEGQVWRLDGTVTSTQTVWTAALMGTGTTTVSLEAYNRAYTDTATVPITINPCTDAGVSMDAGMVDSGAGMDAGVVDAGQPDTGVDAGEPDTGVVDTGVDAGQPDTGVVDTGVDAGQPDTGVVDTGVDAGQPDTGVVDTGVDAGQLDTGVVDTGVDAGEPDTGVVDTGVDAGEPDTGVPDTGVDAGEPDTGVVDTGVDAGEPDTGVVDTGVDAGEPDTGVEDTGVPDTGVEDTGVPDTGVEDTGVFDTGVEDTGVPDTGVEDTGVVPPDAGFPDTGVAPTADSGASVFDEIGISGDGCSCESHGVPDDHPAPWVGLGLLGLLLLRRRRR